MPVDQSLISATLLLNLNISMVPSKCRKKKLPTKIGPTMTLEYFLPMNSLLGRGIYASGCHFSPVKVPLLTTFSRQSLPSYSKAFGTFAHATPLSCGKKGAL